jgi:hypothetical protein
MAKRQKPAPAKASQREYYIVNTDSGYPPSHRYMLKEERAAAFFDPWKYEIDRIKKGDLVFLYQSGVGIIAVGKASGRIDVGPFKHGKRHERDGKHSQKLLNFTLVDPPITAKAISAISEYAEGARVILRPTVVHLRPGAGLRLHKLATMPVDAGGNSGPKE